MTKNDSILDINTLLTGYCDDVQDLIVKKAYEIAKEGRKLLKATSPVNKRNTKTKGNYAKGWSVKKQTSKGEVHCTIYNKTDWQLAHLLEKSHLTRNGGKTKPQVHIKPVEETCIERYTKEIEEGIKKVYK